MKALSVREPFASLIAHGIKSIETRTWSTNYRGDLLICASKSKAEIDWNMVPKKHHNLILMKFGSALCIAELFKIESMQTADQPDACCSIYPGAMSWHLRNIHKIKPFEVSGKLRLFEVDDELIFADSH